MATNLKSDPHEPLEAENRVLMSTSEKSWGMGAVEVHLQEKGQEARNLNH